MFFFFDRKKPQEIRCLAFQLLDAFHCSDPNTFIDPNTFRRTWVEMLYHAALIGGFHVNKNNPKNTYAQH
jgi:hypothetical protein